MALLVSRRQFWVAMTITLALHAAILFVLSVQPVRSESVPLNHFVAVDFMDEALMEEFEEQSFEELIQSRLDEQVANLAANEGAERSGDRRSSVSESEMQGLSASVEAELQAMEKAEFERLAAEQKEFDLAGIPDDGANDEIRTFTEWDKRYDGQVTVSYDLDGRMHRTLPIPGYKCQVAGTVSITVTVSKDGRVSSAKIIAVTVLDAFGQPRPESEADECIARSALESARASVFDAAMVETKTGRLNYRFLAQK